MLFLSIISKPKTGEQMKNLSKKTARLLIASLVMMFVTASMLSGVALRKNDTPQQINAATPAITETGALFNLDGSYNTELAWQLTQMVYTLPQTLRTGNETVYNRVHTAANANDIRTANGGTLPTIRLFQMSQSGMSYNAWRIAARDWRLAYVTFPNDAEPILTFLMDGGYRTSRFSHASFIAAPANNYNTGGGSHVPSVQNDFSGTPGSSLRNTLTNDFNELLTFNNGGGNFAHVADRLRRPIDVGWQGNHSNQWDIWGNRHNLTDERLNDLIWVPAGNEIGDNWGSTGNVGANNLWALEASELPEYGWTRMYLRSAAYGTTGVVCTLTHHPSFSELAFGEDGNSWFNGVVGAIHIALPQFPTANTKVDFTEDSNINAFVTTTTAHEPGAVFLNETATTFTVSAGAGHLLSALSIRGTTISLPTSTTFPGGWSNIIGGGQFRTRRCTCCQRDVVIQLQGLTLATSPLDEPLQILATTISESHAISLPDMQPSVDGWSIVWDEITHSPNSGFIDFTVRLDVSHTQTSLAPTLTLDEHGEMRQLSENNLQRVYRIENITGPITPTSFTITADVLNRNTYSAASPNSHEPTLYTVEHVVNTSIAHGAIFSFDVTVANPAVLPPRILVQINEEWIELDHEEKSSLIFTYSFVVTGIVQPQQYNIADPALIRHMVRAPLGGPGFTVSATSVPLALEGGSYTFTVTALRGYEQALAHLQILFLDANRDEIIERETLTNTNAIFRVSNIYSQVEAIDFISNFHELTLNTYQVTFDTNGGSNVAHRFATHNQPASEPARPTRTGFVFGGWWLENGQVGEQWGHQFNFSAPLDGHVTLYARWIPAPFTIFFDTNGGTALDSVTQDFGSSLTAPEDPTRPGFRFDGWFSDAALKNPFAFETMPANGATIYAKWINEQDGLRRQRLIRAICGMVIATAVLAFVAVGVTAMIKVKKGKVKTSK
jgi:uncharacterized repeat protein (TIGR02543 family)